MAKQTSEVKWKILLVVAIAVIVGLIAVFATQTEFYKGDIASISRLPYTPEQPALTLLDTNIYLELHGDNPPPGDIGPNGDYEMLNFTVTATNSGADFLGIAVPTINGVSYTDRCVFFSDFGNIFSKVALQRFISGEWQEVSTLNLVEPLGAICKVSPPIGFSDDSELLPNTTSQFRIIASLINAPLETNISFAFDTFDTDDEMVVTPWLEFPPMNVIGSPVQGNTQTVGYLVPGIFVPTKAF